MSSISSESRRGLCTARVSRDGSPRAASVFLIRHEPDSDVRAVSAPEERELNGEPDGGGVEEDAEVPLQPECSTS